MQLDHHDCRGGTLTVNPNDACSLSRSQRECVVSRAATKVFVRTAKSRADREPNFIYIDLTDANGVFVQANGPVKVKLK